MHVNGKVNMCASLLLVRLCACICVWDFLGVNVNVQLMCGALDHCCVYLMLCGIIIDVPS